MLLLCYSGMNQLGVSPTINMTQPLITQLSHHNNNNINEPTEDTGKAEIVVIWRLAN